MNRLSYFSPCFTFYIKDNSVNDIETLKYNIINELEYLRNYTNIEIIKVYGYEGELAIKHEEIEFPNEHKDYGNSSDDYDDGYKATSIRGGYIVSASSKLAELQSHYDEHHLRVMTLNDNDDNNDIAFVIILMVCSISIISIYPIYKTVKRH